MRKYKSTDSHYLELATSSFNFRSLNQSSNRQSPQSASLLTAVTKTLASSDKEILQPSQSHPVYDRLPNDIFLSRQNPNNTSFESLFGGINAFKHVDYTQSDSSKTIVHCHLQEMTASAVESSSLPKISKEDLYSLEAQLSSTNTPQVIYRRIKQLPESSSLTLASIHMNKAFLQLFGASIEEFLVLAALQRQLPELLINANGFEEQIHREDQTDQQQSPLKQCQFVNSLKNRILNCSYIFESSSKQKNNNDQLSQQLSTLRILSITGSTILSPSSPTNSNTVSSPVVPKQLSMDQSDSNELDTVSLSILSKAFEIHQKNTKNQESSHSSYGEGPRKIRFTTSDSSTASC